ncbi:MAG TPA: sugar ABC transporter ATP-binding protein [Clostridiaceae bacterium]|nr:sugar ABC transporter ATP-binding protein [Clostridiaceae bacterium]
MPILEIENLSKSFDKVEVLNNVNFNLKKGEIHALMGENGAGKSTLAKIIVGVYEASSGIIKFEEKLINFKNTRQSKEAGISMVFQEFNLFPDLSVAENLFLMDETFYSKSGVVNSKLMVQKAKQLLSMFKMDQSIDPHDIIENLSVAQKQIIEILKAVYHESKIIILDEPTASLSPNEVEILFNTMRQLKAQDVSFIIVSHRINEIYEISDRISVLRDGKMVINGQETHSLDQNDLIKAMVGRNITDLYGGRERDASIQEEFALEVEHLSDPEDFLSDISFKVHQGEIFGIAGLVGAGRTELLRNIFGLDKRKNGKVKVFGQEVKNNIKDAMNLGLGFVSEDRKSEGLIQDLSITINSSLAYLAKSNKSSIISHTKEAEECLKMVDLLDIKISDIDNPVKTLSGGNQQKVLLSKWLMTEPKILLIDEPTRGIDIAAKSEIYALLKKLAREGVTIVVVSSEIPEILGICDQVMVLRDGKVSANLSIKEATEEKIGYYATIG